MTRNQRTFAIALAVSIGPQLAIWVAYWFFGFDRSGGETTFQKIVLWIYWPVLQSMQALIEPRTWWQLGFLIGIGPLIGAVVYSVVIAVAAVLLRRSDNASEQPAA
jgi:hypothetical protein